MRSSACRLDFHSGSEPPTGIRPIVPANSSRRRTLLSTTAIENGVEPRHEPAHAELAGPEIEPPVDLHVDAARLPVERHCMCIWCTSVDLAAGRVAAEERAPLVRERRDPGCSGRRSSNGTNCIEADRLDLVVDLDAGTSRATAAGSTSAGMRRAETSRPGRAWSSTLPPARGPGCRLRRRWPVRRSPTNVGSSEAGMPWARHSASTPAASVPATLRAVDGARIDERPSKRRNRSRSAAAAGRARTRSARARRPGRSRGRRRLSTGW